MKFKIPLLILVIALTAGCVVPLPTPTPTGAALGKGLEITSFTVEPSSVFSGGTVRVIMEVENQGGATAFNESSLAYLTGSNINLGDTSGFYWYSKSGESEVKYFNKDMRPADVVRGIPADTKRFSWVLTAPNVTAGQTREDIFIGRIYHDYTTGVNGNVWIYTEAEADAARASGRALNKATFTSTSGPVLLDVSVSPDPVILYQGENTFSLYIKISNAASGTIYRNNTLDYAHGNVSLTADQLNKVFIEIQTSPDLDFSSAECTGEQELVAGRTTTIVCDFTVKTPPATFKSYPVNVIAHYGYFTERTATVTVQGR